MRIGLGYDVHAFCEGRPLVLGGVRIDHPKGLSGHSDADVLVHALMDAILGALREGDIGKLFPDTDAAYKNADSMELLSVVVQLMSDRGWDLMDADCVIVCEEPKIAPHRESMRQRLAKTLGVSTDAVGVKATTTEGLGFEGRAEGIAAYAAVLIQPK